MESPAAKTTMAGGTAAVAKKRKNYFLRNWQIYSMILPGVLFFAIFKYVPLAGSIIAFQNYNVFQGILGSPFVGWEHFQKLFTYPELIQVLKNTLIINIYQLLFEFPAPIILALLLNEVRKMMFKRVVQSILYLPHFLSWVIVGGLVMNLLSPNGGLLNELMAPIFGSNVFYIQEPQYFRTILVSSGVWKEMGWGTIVYLAAMTGINPDLYESAEVDGAGKFRQVFSVTIPSILPTIMVLLLLRIGNIMDLGFEQVYSLLNPLVRETGEVIDTYVYRIGLQNAQFSYTTAIGLFKSVVGFVMLVGANYLSRRLTGNSIF